MWLKITNNYSLNFSFPKRSNKKIKYIIIHYTGMKNEMNAIKKLCDEKTNVSAHYFIKRNGEVINLVPDCYKAWHAGKSRWKTLNSLNKYSIGIELHNPGHEHGYKKFPLNQLKSLRFLLKKLIKKYKINLKNILGHSDIAPNRKKDPGEKFPWKYFSKNKIGYWHSLNEKKLIKNRNQTVNKSDKVKFIKNLYNIGYPKNIFLNKHKYLKLLTIAFQRRFRQELVNGIIDKECLFISNNLAKNLK